MALRPLLHLLCPLCFHWIAEEMTVSVLVDVTTAALCSGASTCAEVIYINGLQQTVFHSLLLRRSHCCFGFLSMKNKNSDQVACFILAARKELHTALVVGIFKMVVLPVLGQLADEYGRKPLLMVTVSTSIFPFAVLAWNKSKGFVYAYYVLRTVSYILSQGSIFCIAVAYVVSIALLIFGPVYMQLFLVETVRRAPRQDQHSTGCTKISSPTLKGISIISFFYELGMSGISGVLLYYLKAAFGFNKNQLSEILMMVGIGSIFSQMLILPLINPLVGEKLILCTALLASIAYALFYGLAWASWVPYLSASFGVVYVLVKPSTYAIISKASSSSNQDPQTSTVEFTMFLCLFRIFNCYEGKSTRIHCWNPVRCKFVITLAMSPLTSWFLSSNAPFKCKGFSIVCASLCMVIPNSLSFSDFLYLSPHLCNSEHFQFSPDDCFMLCCFLKQEEPANDELNNNIDDMEAALLS
ncbi:hypothetical protein CK203_103686 [Vitis vinifera]|uniref:Uncharacterized protein n=1 Tax=Vitis vinifera TaxID=29760 RepID=A0A438DNE2_VITVI|nr:hypothetical protein CK203_103686 [Vitis vinifera]